MLNIEKYIVAKSRLEYELLNDGYGKQESTHETLLKSFVDLVVASGWCGKEEIENAFEEYKLIIS